MTADKGAPPLAERQYRALFTEHPQPMWVCDRDDLCLLAVNHAMARHYGYAVDELLGKDMRLLWHRDEQSVADSAMAMCRDARAGSAATPMATVWHHVHRDGRRMDMEVFVGETEFDGHPAWQILAHDITERNRIEAELARLSRAQRMRNACNQMLVRAGSESELWHAVCELAVHIGGYRMGWVGLARDEATRPIDIVASAGDPGGYIDELRLSWSPHEPGGRGPSATCVRSGRTVIMSNAQYSRVCPDRARGLTRLGCHTIACLPLRNAQQTFGVLCLYAPEVLQLGSQETQLLESMAADLTHGMESLRARAEQQRLQAIMVKVATAVSADTGAAFFEHLAQNMADALGAQTACVVRLQPPVQGRYLHAVTVSHVIDGVAQPPHEYALQGTPSAQLLTKTTLEINDQLARSFPEHQALQRAGMRSYAGRQLCDSDGAPMGMVMVMYREPLAQTPFSASALQIFAVRAASELQRQMDDTRIRQQASLLDKARDAIIVRDLEHRVTFWNAGAERMYGWSRQEVLGRPVIDLLYHDPQDFALATERVLSHGEWSGELLHCTRDGRVIEIEGRWTLVRNEAGEIDSILAINSDIGARKADEREIERLAYFDSLTGLPNRAQFMQRMTRALATAQRRQQGGALLFIDMDNFKTLNDTLGHDQGDLLLQTVAQRLSSCVRDVDTVARLGGDEFVVLIEHIGAQPTTLAENANKVGEKILAALSAPYALTGHQYRSTPSIGIALFDHACPAVGELLKQADLAMYQAKQAGRSTLRFFDPSMQKAVDEHVALEADLRTALSRQEFLLHFQPQVDVHGGILGVEALLRWQHPQRGMVPPAQFIAAAEETGLILPLGRWVLHQACALLASWQAQPALAHLSMAVNVSSRQFRDPCFVDDVARVLAVTGAPAAQLTLELTESLLVEDMDTTIATMQALRAHGVGIALDDFGTGYSSLAYLRRLPLSQLKIDRCFVHDLLNDDSSCAIVRTILALTHSLGLGVIAEGVETAEQRDWLARAGCELYQGYLFGRPLPPQDLAQLLQAHLGMAAQAPTVIP
ncbi:EAL domain-containing protein [Oryzisolibacter sp. LB2S]|uniref:sensor domain-containing phosphodiesterase n=1 Tax=Alicycliphilus soli TaxID=3228789 RepID=UPI003457682D